MREAAKNKLKEEAWLQKQRNVVADIGASQQRNFSASLEVDQHCVVIEDVNPPSKMRRVVLRSEEQEKRSELPATQPSSLPLMSLG